MLTRLLVALSLTCFLTATAWADEPPPPDPPPGEEAKPDEKKGEEAKPDEKKPILPAEDPAKKPEATPEEKPAEPPPADPPKKDDPPPADPPPADDGGDEPPPADPPPDEPSEPEPPPKKGTTVDGKYWGGGFNGVWKNNKFHYGVMKVGNKKFVLRGNYYKGKYGLTGRAGRDFVRVRLKWKKDDNGEAVALVGDWDGVIKRKKRGGRINAKRRMPK